MKQKTRVLLSALMASLVLGCSGADQSLPTATSPTGPQFARSPWSSFEKQLDAYLRTLNCTVEPVSYAKKAIGPAGGTLTVGRHTLVVPAGALSTTIEISGSTTFDGTASVHLYPSGLTFATPATLRLDYSHCDKIKNSKQVAYTTDDASTILEVQPSKDIVTRQVVEGSLSHFSRYAVAW